jgi:hypothetical protein
MELDIVVLSEISQTHKEKYHRFSLIFGSFAWKIQPGKVTKIMKVKREL